MNFEQFNVASSYSSNSQRTTQKNNGLISRLSSLGGKFCYIILCLVAFIFLLVLFLVNNSKAKSLEKYQEENSNIMRTLSSTSANEHDIQLKYNELDKLKGNLNSEIKDVKDNIEKYMFQNKEYELSIKDIKDKIDNLNLQIASISKSIGDISNENDIILKNNEELEQKINLLKKM